MPDTPLPPEEAAVDATRVEPFDLKAAEDGSFALKCNGCGNVKAWRGKPPWVEFCESGGPAVTEHEHVCTNKAQLLEPNVCTERGFCTCACGATQPRESLKWEPEPEVRRPAGPAVEVTRVVSDPHHDERNEWKVVDTKLYHRTDTQSKWTEAKRVGFTPERILAIASLLTPHPSSPPDEPPRIYRSVENLQQMAANAYQMLGEIRASDSADREPVYERLFNLLDAMQDPPAPRPPDEPSVTPRPMVRVLAEIRNLLDTYSQTGFSVARSMLVYWADLLTAEQETEVTKCGICGTLSRTPDGMGSQAPVAAPPASTGAQKWCESTLGRDAKCDLPAGHQEKHRAGYLVWTDHEANRPSWPAPSTAVQLEVTDADVERANQIATYCIATYCSPWSEFIRRVLEDYASRQGAEK